MKTKVTVEAPAFTVSYSSFNSCYSRDVSWRELKLSNIGDIFSAGSDACGRDVCDKSAKVVYKDDQGVALLFTTERSADTPEGESLPTLVYLEWFQFNY